MKEEPCSVIVAACLILNFVYYIENCSTSTQKRPAFPTTCAGLIKGDAFFRDQQQSIVWKRATYSQKTFCQFDALCVFRHVAAENMNIDKMTHCCIIKTLFITELPPVCPHSLKVNSSPCEFKKHSTAGNHM